jgi:hypothetical protein
MRVMSASNLLETIPTCTWRPTTLDVKGSWVRAGIAACGAALRKPANRGNAISSWCHWFVDFFIRPFFFFWFCYSLFFSLLAKGNVPIFLDGGFEVWDTPADHVLDSTTLAVNETGITG